MDTILGLLHDVHVYIYVALVVTIQFFVILFKNARESRRKKRRINAKLTEKVIINQSQRLRELKFDALSQELALLLSIVVLPFVLWWFSDTFDPEVHGKKLLFTFLLFFVLLLFNATDFIKAMFGGLAFRTVTAFNGTIQVGDRVTLRGLRGKVLEIGIFYIKLQTLDDDLVSIPSASLWMETLISTNAGDRSSLCVIPFYLSSLSTKEQRKEAEDAIGNSILGSTYFDPEKPMHIYLSQEPEHIKLTAKAYVANTYNAQLFKSDIASAFLKFANDNQIPLLTPSLRKLLK